MTIAITPDLVAEARALALAAGRTIMEVYAGDFAVTTKDDNSPVTLADQAAEAIILPVLARLLPGVPIVAEEAAAAGRIPEVGEAPFWLVDPLDGTKEFINRRGEFTVNIALIDDRLPVLGVVHAPAIGLTYVGSPLGASKEKDGAAAQAIATRRSPAAGMIAVASRSHRSPEEDAFLGRHKIADLISSGSSIKFCLVAEGAADVYPRFGRTMEWDTAAGHAVLRAAGGRMTTIDGAPFLYAKAGFANPGFIAWGA